MTGTAYETRTSVSAGTWAQVSITEQTVTDIAGVLTWHNLPPHEANQAAREVLAAIVLAGTTPADDDRVPLPAAPTRSDDQKSAPGTELAVVPSTIDVNFEGLTLPDPTAATARAWVKDRYGEMMVDDGARYRTPAEAEADGRRLVAVGQTDHGLALVAAARRATELAAARGRRRRWPFRALRRN